MLSTVQRHTTGQCERSNRAGKSINCQTPARRVFRGTDLPLGPFFSASTIDFIVFDQ